MFLLIHNERGIVGYAAGDSIWRTIYKKSNNNLTKSIQHTGEEFNAADQTLTIKFDTIVKPNAKEEMNLESINIHFSPTIKDDK